MSEAPNVQPPNAPVIPDKLYFRIGEVARLLDVEAHTLRFWESEFPQLKVGKGGTGQRLYRRRDVEMALEIKRLLYDEGYTIPGARQLLQTRQRKDSAHPKSENHSSSPVTSVRREVGMERLRSQLRDLRELLNDAPGTARMPASSSPPANRTAATPSRRGLHLAPTDGRRDGRFPAKSADSGTLPGLFDPETE